MLLRESRLIVLLPAAWCSVRVQRAECKACAEVSFREERFGLPEEAHRLSAAHGSPLARDWCLIGDWAATKGLCGPAEGPGGSGVRTPKPLARFGTTGLFDTRSPRQPQPQNHSFLKKTHKERNTTDLGHLDCRGYFKSPDLARN